MECPHIPELEYSDFNQRLHEKIGGRRFPIAGSLELTFRCNLRCQHCYVSHGHQGIPDLQELTTKEIHNILDQVVDEGCLWLLLTGGEPLMRRDFLDIYTHAKRKGLLLTLFTNGTMLSPHLADTLAEWRPYKIEITLYGHTQETYERVTGIPGSHARCMRGIEILLERDLPLRLKTMLMTLNQHELEDMQVYAESLGVDFRFDPMLNTTVEGSKAPLSFRIPAEEVVQYDLADEKRLNDWLAFCERFIGVPIDDRYLYVCGAGVRAFHIDPYGLLSICMMSRSQNFGLREGTFHDGWVNFLPKVRYQAPHGDYHCNQCGLLPLCGQCPGWAQMEHGVQQAPVKFLCDVAHQRAEAFGLTNYSSH